MYRLCPSAKSVSKASEDFPEPETPVKTTSLRFGIESSSIRRLCSRAPTTWSRSDRARRFRGRLARWCMEAARDTTGPSPGPEEARRVGSVDLVTGTPPDSFARC
jgi:hypothetical protein